MFETTSQFFFKLCTTLPCHKRYFFCTFLAETTWFGQGAHQSAKFQTFDCSGKISPNLYFDRLLLLRVYRGSAKKKYGGNKFLMIPKSHAKFEEKLTFCFKNDKNLANFDQSTKNLKNLHFDWSLLCKVYNASPKKVQRSYISWHWRVMQNLKKNRLVV